MIGLPPKPHVQLLSLQIFSLSLMHNLIAFAASTNHTELSTPDHLSQRPSDEVQVRINEISSSVRNGCDHAERNLDRCSARLIGLGHSDIYLPNTMQELNSVYCPKFKEAVSCIKNSTNCYKPFERQIINWVLSSSRKMNYKRCKNEGEKERFLKLTHSCLSQMKNPMSECMSSYIASLEAIADVSEFVEHLTEDDIQIQLSCCANRRFKECVAKNAKQTCKPLDSLRKLKRTNSVSSQRVAHKYIQKAMLDTMEDLKSTLDGMALTGPEFICDNLDEKFCRTKFDGRYGGRFPRHKSIVPAMIKIYANK